ncbi:hypothetical protein WICPIJ_006783 [Wickerhamomyces pijperi]|uniref:Uncharacterized protein n=1 Tax=Wickerhamomyces pijperi TaxID=599730 RepID=A0A9P8Q3S9_WICPI|nr:hypothetical protein WICPIJ_006783 [Wickerhamomyces pijperi]
MSLLDNNHSTYISFPRLDGPDDNNNKSKASHDQSEYLSGDGFGPVFDAMSEGCDIFVDLCCWVGNKLQSISHRKDDRK